MASLQKKKHYQVSLIRDEVKRYVDVIKRIVEVCCPFYLTYINITS